MLKKIIHQLNEKDYTLLATEMEKTKAQKYLLLLTNYRNGQKTDKELLSKLNINTTSFYTLKSRLFVRIQYFLFNNTQETRTELIRNIAKIDHLVYNAPRETSIPILKKLEAELIKNDMPNELTIVYKALKKVHINSPKHYDYSLLYNKHIAYNLAQDKAEDMLSSFCKHLGSFYLNRDHSEYKRLQLYKTEMENLNRLYDSHRLKIYKNILTIQYALFLSGIEQSYEGIPVEQLLNETTETLQRFKEDRVYKHLGPVMDFLYFEYYNQLKLRKSALTHYNKIANDFDTLLLFNHTCFTSHFFLSKIEYQANKSAAVELYTPETPDEDGPHADDLPNYILFYYNKAAESFRQENYPEAIQTLNTLFQKLSFRSIAFIEVELKLFLAVLYYLNNDEAHSTVIIRNTLRKISEEKSNETYLPASCFIRFMKALSKKSGNKKDERAVLMYQLFKTHNIGRYKIFGFMSLKDELLTLLITKQSTT